jgi:hypothetical protein
LFEGFEREDITVPYTMEDFRRDYVKEHVKDLTAGEWREVIKKLAPDKLAELERFLSQRKHETTSRKPRKK